jgi:hypothetical protein
MRMTRRAALLAGAVCFALPAAVRAQDDLSAQCTSVPATADPTRRFCNLVAEGIGIVQPRFGLAASGGNPLPGASSTLGMRLGSVPRISVNGRFTAARVTMPDLRARSDDEDVSSIVPSFNIDAALGIFSGFSLLPTIGGFGSIDLVASAGMVSLPGDEGFNGGNASTWGAGVRLGLLRESFTAPGASVTAMYRKVGGVDYGDRALTQQESFFETSSMRVLSLRGLVGKRLFFIGAMAGVGYDRYKSDVEFGVSNPGVVGPARFDFSRDGFSSSRVTAFGSAQWTLLILSVIGEVGYQSGGDEFTAPLSSGRISTSEKSAYFASLAIRLAI